MNLCKDCKHAEPYLLFFYDVAKCKHKSVCNLADGSGGTYCGTERIYGGCGREGKNFEEKIKFWGLVKNYEQ